MHDEVITLESIEELESVPALDKHNAMVSNPVAWDEEQEEQA
jgi:hypothetical protein